MPTGLLQERVAALRRVFLEAGIETAIRADLTATSRTDLLRLLRRFRNSYDVLAVKCTNQAVSTVACRDRRVDLVFFDPRIPKIRFNHSFARLLGGAMEFNLMSSLLRESRTGIISRIVKEAGIARHHRTKVVLSSGCSDPEMVRSPNQIKALAASVGLTMMQTASGISEVPISIVTRNVERRSRRYIEEGVRVVVPPVGRVA